MAFSKNRRTILIAAAGALLIIALVLIFVFLKPSFLSNAGASSVYTPGEYPEGTSFADIAEPTQLSAEERFNAYDPKNDPAHPVLDEKVKLSISSSGSRPGFPKPADDAEEQPETTPQPHTPEPSPAATPSVTLNPGIILPGMRSGTVIPGIELPELYITEPEIPGPLFTGDRYTVEWNYTAGRKADFSVSVSTDHGRSFSVLAEGLTEYAYELTLPEDPAEACVIRVTAFVEGIQYKYADTEPFTLVRHPEAAPEPVTGYIDPAVQYTNIPGVRINSAVRAPVWFKAESTENTDKLIWQLSTVPFFGTKESYKNEAGVIASGEADMAEGGEFSVDLNEIVRGLTETGTNGGNKTVLPPQSVYDFYIRAVALDEQGECIGDPGRGLQFSYGVPDVISILGSASFAEDSQIGIFVETPYYNEWEWKRVSPGVLNRDLSSPSDELLFEAIDDSEAGSDIIKRAVQVELQAATSPFTNASALGLTEPEGLVYSYTDTAPQIGDSKNGSYYFTPWFHGIEYEEFVPSKEELDAMGGIYYYVRALFYVPDEKNPSILRPMPSETMTIAYRVTSAKQNEVKKVIVKSNIPFTQFLRYAPVEWQDPNYEEYFEVTRHIEAEEMNFYIRNSDTGDFLLPYALHIQQYGWTREQYQAKLDEMLPPGASFHYLKSDPGFWDEFFSLLKAIYTSVQEAYADAKNAAVSLVDYIPLIGNDAKEYLKKAVRYAIDYGLASIGLPPCLPNLDALAEGGLDYCLKIAVDEALRSAGVPLDSPAAEEITDEVREKLTSGLSDELTKAMLAQQQNPFHADFLRIYTEKLYEPAYIDVLVANYSETEYSVPGTLYMTFGNGFDVYRSKSLYIPRLKPSESTVIRAYLDHVRNQYDGYGQYFDKLYNGTSGEPYEMRICTYYQLPDVKIAAKEQGIPPAPLPYVTEYVYDRQDYSYIRSFIPAEAILEEDDSVDPLDYFD